MIKWFKKFIKKIEEENKKSFGSKKMDCCELNRKNDKKDRKFN